VADHIAARSGASEKPDREGASRKGTFGQSFSGVVPGELSRVASPACRGSRTRHGSDTPGQKRYAKYPHETGGPAVGRRAARERKSTQKFHFGPAPAHGGPPPPRHLSGDEDLDGVVLNRNWRPQLAVDRYRDCAQPPPTRATCLLRLYDREDEACGYRDK